MARMRPRSKRVLAEASEDLMKSVVCSPSSYHSHFPSTQNSQLWSFKKPSVWTCPLYLLGRVRTCIARIRPRSKRVLAEASDELMKSRRYGGKKSMLNPPFVWGLGFRDQGSGFRVQVSGCRVQGSGFRVQGSGYRVQGAGFRVQGSGFRVQGSGLMKSRRYGGRKSTLNPPFISGFGVWGLRFASCDKPCVQGSASERIWHM